MLRPRLGSWRPMPIEAGDKAADGLARPSDPRSTARAVQGLDRGRPSWCQPAAAGGPPASGRETLWHELAALRWGPALNDPTPGIIIDRPDPEAMRAALAGADPRDSYPLAERQTIQTENEP